MRSFLTLVRQDLVLMTRNWFVAVIVLMLVLFLALIWFLPTDVAVEAPELFYDATAGQVLQEALLELGADEAAFYASRDALLAELEGRRQGVGIIVEGDLENLSYTFITQGRFAAENLNLLGAALDSVAASARGAQPPQNLTLNLLRDPSDPIPLNEAGVPIFLVFEVVALGFFLVAALIFEEKQEGVIRAFRVSPVGTMRYILSKTVVFLFLGSLYALIMLLLGLGFDVDYGPLLLLVLLGSSMMTLAGIAVAVFFNNISEWFFPGVFVLTIFLLPSISYAIPAFAPGYVTWIPSYPMLFGIREILFPTGKEGFMLGSAGLLGLYNLIALAAAYVAVDRKLMQS